MPPCEGLESEDAADALVRAPRVVKVTSLIRHPSLLWQDVAKWQIILGVGFLEWWSELRLIPGEKHYMKGGKPGYGAHPALSHARELPT